MSSPLSSLKKSQKNPIMLGSRSMPFRLPEYSEDESKLLDEITGSMATSRIKAHQRDPFTGGLPKLDINRTHMSSNTQSPRAPTSQLERSHTSSSFYDDSNTFLTAPSDKELMSVMMNRITLLEQKVKSQSKDISEKDKKINILEDKVRIMQRAQGEMTENQTHQLERKCLLLQQQVHEMEAFLADYGMVWVGEKSDPSSDLYNDSTSLSSGSEEEETWRPGTATSLSTSPPEFKVDYDKVIENIRDLNVLAGEGVSKIQHTTDGARLKLPDPVPIALYANGMVMFSGPFRPFTDIPTQQCIQDITDGYFPSELQKKYPEGIPFTVTDFRDVHFKDNRKEIFTGAGQILGGDSKPSRLVPEVKANKAENQNDSKHMKVATELPGPKMTVGQFLQKLPRSVVKDGKIIDIRNSVGETIKGNKDSTDVTVVETETVKDMKRRLSEEVVNRPMTPRDITTLRIKDETGNHTYILKMKFTETIGDLRNYINIHRSSITSPYQIMTAYPNKVYDNNSATLVDSGLTPNAVLHLRLHKPS